MLDHFLMMNKLQMQNNNLCVSQTQKDRMKSCEKQGISALCKCISAQVSNSCCVTEFICYTV